MCECCYQNQVMLYVVFIVLYDFHNFMAFDFLCEYMQVVNKLYK